MKYKAPEVPKNLEISDELYEYLKSELQVVFDTACNARDEAQNAISSINELMSLKLGKIRLQTLKEKRAI